MKYYLVIIPFLFISLVACINQPPAETDSQQITDESTPVVEAPVPTLVVSQEENGPNEQIFIEGSGFPANQVIVFYYADSETNLGPAVAQVVSSPSGEFVLELLTPTAWPGADFRGETRLLVVAEAADDTSIMASAPIVIEYEDALTRYENRSAGYTVEIPAVWETTEAQITPLGELVLMGPEPISPGNPSNSMVISVDPTVVDEAAAAQYLICGAPDCTDDIAFTITTVNGLEARSLVIGSDNTPDLEWFFVRYEDRLIYFTLHDPLTLETLDGLVQSFSLTEQVSTEIVAVESSEADLETAEPTLEMIEATETPEDTKTPTPTEEPTTPTPIITSTQTITATATPEATETATVTPTPTLTATATDSPTETATATSTQTATSTPTSTPSPTATSTQTSTPTLTVTATEAPSEEPTNTSAPILGPLQTSLDLLTIMSRSEEDADTLDYFTQRALTEINSPADIQAFFELDRAPFAFAVERLPGEPIVRVEIESYIDSPIEVRDLEFVLENGRWRVDSVSVVEPEGSGDAGGEEPGTGDGSGGEEGGGEEGG